MNRHIIYKIIALVAWIMSLLSCTADLPATDTPLAGEGEGVLQLSVPLTRSMPTTDETGEQAATADERRITSLWFLAYPTTDGDGETLVKKLDTNKLEHDTYKPFSIKMKYGTYRIYVVANVPELTAGTTEDELKAIILKYKEGDEVSLPSPTSTYGLPMVYQMPTTYTLSSTTGSDILADLVYTCVKVRYTLVFDNTTNGISNPVFGTNVLKINGVSVRNIADRAPLLPGTDISTDLTLFDTDASGAFNGTYQVGAYDPADPDNNNYTFSKTTIEYTEAGQWAYRGTFYLPEHYVTADTQADQTQMLIAATLYTASGVSRASLEYTIELGDTQGQTDAVGGNNVRQLPRGRFYDITGRITGLGNKIEATAAVQDWTLQTVDAELNGPYYLYVAETSVALEAGKDVTVACRTDAPKLRYESPKYTLSDGTETDIYQVEFNRDEAGAYASFTVRIHPNMPPVADAATIEGIAKYFYIVAGGLKKKIEVSPLKLEPYLIVTPQNYTVYIKEVSNLTTYAVTYTYRTNLTNIQVAANKDINHVGTAVDGQPFTAANAHNGTVSNGTGTLVCTLDEPYVSGNFPNANTATYTFTATGYEKELTETATLQIIPNATSYRLHFRPLTDDWSNPHIYVYQPLYTPGGAEVQIKSGGEQLGENAILYGFTGCVTFKGWTDEGGPISNYWPNATEGSIVTASSGFDPATDINNNLNSDDEEYYWGVDYCPSFREDCCAGYNVNRKWPGVKMKEDTENPGWYYFDLPLLAEPGTALIMFADGHNGPASTDTSGKYRYPAHMVPGVPLYNFADKDGWFLYDYTQGDKNEFVDDKPDIMDRMTFKDGTYRIWLTNNSSGYNDIHLWTTDGTAYKTWNVGEDLVYDNTTSRYYYDVTVSDAWRPTGNINYKLHNNGGNPQTGDLTIYSSQWQTVTGKDYDYEVYL